MNYLYTTKQKNNKQRKESIFIYGRERKNVYEFAENETCKLLNVKKFHSASEEWLDFVMANRRIQGFTHDYDIVIGPVTNDCVYTAFSLYEGGVIDKETLIGELKTYLFVDQYLFHTDKALQYLRFQSANPIQL